jgi:hypothetical protein
MINARVRINKQEREERTAMKRIILMAVSVFLALTLAAPVAFGQVGQGATASGHASKLVAAWWQWALEEPTSQSPLGGSYDEAVPPGDIQCDGSNPSGTWFLGGSFSEAPADRTCTVPADTQLFFPVVNSVFIITEPGETEEIARKAVNGQINGFLRDGKFKVTIDGKEVQSKRIVRAESPLFIADIPEDNVFDSPTFDLPAGKYQGVGDGLWVTLPGLSEGEHTIHWEFHDGFSQDITYHVTVE